ncbi:MAG TPA: hypothetical protein DGG94_03625 [Micromonosporaceae bacterium]|nr:hypothetical protein [Micromonosporaceae bacterium]HCU48894.1 hypothetical protein [Micromonosporaceae bacterium]
MSESTPDLSPHDVKSNYMRRRRDKIVAEIQANRRGEYVVPTWVLTAALLAIVLGLAALLYFT